MTEFEELKRRVEELERRLVEVCPGPCRCPYRNRLITGDNSIWISWLIRGQSHIIDHYV